MRAHALVQFSIRRMQPIRVDDTQWPLVIITFEGRSDRAALDAWLSRMDEVHSRGKRFVMIAHIQLHSPDFSHIARMGAWTNANKERTRKWCGGVAVVLASPAYRFLVSAYYLVVAPACPMSVFDDAPSAKAWLRQRLVEERLAIPQYLKQES
jgi:hypothetical protein